MHGRARPAQHFDRLRLSGVHFEQFVDVAEAYGPQRKAIFQHQEGAAGTRAREHRRADRGEAFLAAAALDQHTGHAVQRFGRMGGIEAPEDTAL